jgi:hypothetical protein
MLDQTLFRADYKPIRQLSGTLDLAFTRLFYELPINQQANPSNLYYNLDPDNNITFDVGDYRIILERMMIYTDKSFWLIFHAIDINAPVTDESDRSNRREVLLDVQLLLTLTNGQTVTLNAANGRSSQIGANVFFLPSESDYAELILAGQERMQYRSMQLVVNSALVRIDDLTVKLDLDLLYPREDTAHVERDIKIHLMNDNRDKERYSAAVIAYEKLNDYHHAIIREMWFENGEWQIVTSEVMGIVDLASWRPDERIILQHSRGLK